MPSIAPETPTRPFTSWGWRPTPVRILYVVLSILSAAFPGILAYIILWILMPKAAR